MFTTSPTAPSTHTPNAVRVDAFTHPSVFRIGDSGSAVTKKPSLKTGFVLLDSMLPDGGWSRGELCEILCNDIGIGELALLLPAIRLAQPSHSLWIAPPHLPHAPALRAAGLGLSHLTIVDCARSEDSLWAAEQALASAAADTVCVWVCTAINDTSLRRLKHAAAQGCAVCWLMRPRQFMTHASPAGLRLALCGHLDGMLMIDFLKRRGLPSNQQVRLPTRVLPCLRRSSEVLTPARHVRPTSVRGALHAWLDQTVAAVSVSHHDNNSNRNSAIRERRMSPDR